MLKKARFYVLKHVFCKDFRKFAGKKNYIAY